MMDPFANVQIRTHNGDFQHGDDKILSMLAWMDPTLAMNHSLSAVLIHAEHLYYDPQLLAFKVINIPEQTIMLRI